MELSAADPVPTSVRFYLAALLSNSAGREICRCVFFFFFFSSPQTDASSLSRAKQQTDGRVRCMKREKRFVRVQAVRSGTDVFSAKSLNKVAKTNPPSLFSRRSRNESPEALEGGAEDKPTDL